MHASINGYYSIKDHASVIHMDSLIGTMVICGL